MKSIFLKKSSCCLHKQPKMNLFKSFICVGILLLISASSWSQTSTLDKAISLKITNERLEEALKIIGERGGFNFSYNPKEFDINRRITLTASSKAVRQVLDEIFKGGAAYKERQGHIILQKVEVQTEKPKDIIINGYIFDRETGERIAQASIFEKQTLISAVSNKSGYYRLKLPASLPKPQLEVRKERYFGYSTAVTAPSLDISLLQMPLDSRLQPLSPQVKAATLPPSDTLKVKVPLASSSPMLVSVDTVFSPSKPKRQIIEDVEQTFVDAFASAKQAIHIKNVKDTLYRPFQVSFLPFIGTNHVMSGNVINALSFNIIAGYSLGVTALEVGGVANAVRGNVHGAQIAGFANAVGNSVHGLQVSGFANAVLRNFEGLQISGFANATGGHHSGLQIAGFTNLTGRTFTNGLQIAGFANAVLGTTKGVQISGFSNLVLGNLYGSQISGFANIATKKVRGAQISSFFNYAHLHQQGVQLALFNYADSSGGVPIGLFSFVKRNGYRRLEISTDELNYANLTFKTGVNAFYNILTIGGNFGIANKPLYTFGYGIGSAIRLGRGWMTNIDLTANKIMEEVNRFDSVNGQFYRIALGLEKKLTPQLALFAAASLTGLTAQPGYLKVDLSRLYQPFPVASLQNGLEFTNWLGFQAGIRICNR
ncbi:MAG: STN and carboxypeptidase regulatory-like domain-containing protein [Runella zeae]